MVAGTLGIQDRRLNELYALMEGLKRAYLDDWFDIVLESDNEAACWEWLDAAELGVIPEHRYVVQQLTQRRADQNFRISVRPIQQNANSLARYLASYGAEHWDKMVIVAGPFGRIFELWCDDMGLGPIGDQFMAIHELDMNAEIDDEAAVMDDEVLLAQEMV